jgi:GTP:adenosylcobinamide-phosphate guanylyltransferase
MELEPFNRDGRLLFNVNTPDDYVSAMALAQADDRARLAAERD